MSSTEKKDKESELGESTEDKNKEKMPIEATDQPEGSKSKKNKKKKKKKNKDATTEQEGQNVSGTHTPEPNTSGVKSKLITPTPDECFICGTARDRSVNDGINVVPPEDYEMPGMTKTPLWACSRCRKGLEATTKATSDSIRKGTGNTIHTLFQPASSYMTSQIEECTCKTCVEKREGSKTERELHTTQTYWMELRNIVRCIYRDPLILLNGPVSRTALGSPEMSAIVQKLCACDPHQFFQRLETLTREYLLEVKVRLLEQLSLGYNSVPLAIKFIQMLVNEYSTLCKALPLLLLLLQPLNDESYAIKLGVTVELMNKNIFRELIFAEAFMSSNLPLITAQLKLANLTTDASNKKTADMLDQRYSALDQEMEEIGKMWSNAKADLARYTKEQEKRTQQIKEDMERFREWRKNNKDQVLNNMHRHLHQLLKSSMFTRDPVINVTGKEDVTQTFTLEVDVKKSMLLQQSLTSTPKCKKDLESIKSTLLLILHKYGVEISAGQLSLKWEPLRSQSRSRSPSPSGQSGKEVIVQPVEETQHREKSEIQFLPLSSLTFEITFSGPVSEEGKKCIRERLLPLSENTEVYVKLLEVCVESERYVNNCEKAEYCMKRRKADLSAVNSAHMDLLWEAMQELWKKETMPPQSPKEVVPCEPTVKDGVLLDEDGQEVRPLYEFSTSSSNSSSPCECSACIGSLAARYTQDHFRLLDPTDPFGNQLQLLDTDTGTSQEARTISGDALPKFNNTPDVKGPLTCVHVANMGNSKTKPNNSETSTQAITATRYDTHTTIDIHAPGTLFVSGLIKPPHHMMGHHHKCDSGMEPESMDSSLDNHHCDACSDSNHQHSHSHSHSHSHGHSSSGKTNGSETSAVSKESNGVNGSSTGENGGQKRYCRCCYCELFGPNGPPPLQTSHNYRYYRDRMRQKLEKKKDTRSDGIGSSLDQAQGGSEQPSVEKLLEFIEGPQENEPKVSVRAAKRQRRKKKKSTKPESKSSAKKGQHSKDHCTQEDDDLDDDEKLSNSGNASDDDGNNSESDGEEVIEVRVPTQPQYQLDDIDDDNIPIVPQRRSEEPAKEVPLRKTPSPLANGGGPKDDKPRASTVLRATPNVTATHGGSTTQGRTVTQKSVTHSRSESKQLPVANGHHKPHAPPQVVSKRSEPQVQPRRFTSNNYTSSGGESYRYGNQHQPMRNRQNPSYLPPNLPPRLQRQVQEQMQSSHQGQNWGRQSRHYQQRGGHGYRHQGYPHSGGSHTGPAPDDVFIPKEIGEDSDKEIEEFKRFCMENTPLENRKKITMNVDLKNLSKK